MAGHPVLFLVCRYFVRLVKDGEGYGLSLFLFDFKAGTVQQINTDGSHQDGVFTDFRYKEYERTLLFVVQGEIVEQRIDEISEQLLLNLLREGNWERLCYGLQIKSQKTVQWLVNAGISG